MPSIKSGCSLHTHYEDFVDFLDDFSLAQMVTEPTRGDNILDYFLTSNPTLVNNIEIHPGIADHNMVLVNASIKPVESKQIPRSVPLYKKNCERFKSYIKSNCDKILKDHDTKTVIDKGISQFKFVPYLYEIKRRSTAVNETE